MLRLFLILLAVALMVWIGQRYYMDHPGGQSFWDSLSSSSPSPAGSAAPGTAASSPGSNISPTPTPTPTLTERFNGHRKTLMALTQKILLPLDSKDFSAVEAAKTLQQTQSQLLQYRPDPSYKNLTQTFDRLMQACNVLGQALVDRQGYMQRLRNDMATPAQGTPSPLRMSTLQPSSATDSNAFFRERVLKEWNDRCAYYEPIVDGLLTAM